MIINTKAWHYTLWEYTYYIWDKAVPSKSNLCSYFQRILWSPLILLLAYLTLTLISLMLGLFGIRLSEFGFGSDGLVDYWLPSIYGFKIRPIYFVFLGLEIALWRYALVLAIVIHSALLLFGLMGTVFYIRDRKIRKEEIGYVEPPPSLFMLWLKARKQQVCPLIEFQDAPTQTQDTQ